MIEAFKKDLKVVLEEKLNIKNIVIEPKEVMNFILFAYPKKCRLTQWLSLISLKKS